MTRKHFKSIANRLARAKPPEDQTVLLYEWSMLVNEICEVCASQNPRFDHTRFKDACNFNQH